MLHFDLVTDCISGRPFKYFYIVVLMSSIKLNKIYFCLLFHLFLLVTGLSGPHVTAQEYIDAFPDCSYVNFAVNQVTLFCIMLEHEGTVRKIPQMLSCFLQVLDVRDKILGNLCP